LLKVEVVVEPKEAVVALAVEAAAVEAAAAEAELVLLAQQDRQDQVKPWQIVIVGFIGISSVSLVVVDVRQQAALLSKIRNTEIVCCMTIVTNFC
jgi:hypothetical protein